MLSQPTNLSKIIFVEMSTHLLLLPSTSSIRWVFSACAQGPPLNAARVPVFCTCFGFDNLRQLFE